jgi:NCS1 family nucleobase:cation symporter-1
MSAEAAMMESRSIEHIPEAERHGRPFSLFTLWFASNFQINALVTGAVAVALGLNFGLALLAIVVGNLIGALFMAYHSVQGPRLGLPQMIQSRAQFGYRGAILPFLVVVVMYLGFAVAGGLVAGPALANWLHISRDLGIVIFNVVVLVVALFGYRLIHAVSRIISLLSAIGFVVIFVELVQHVPAHYHGSANNLATFMLAVSVFVSWQITWAPYVSDYSRYLPAKTKGSVTFLFTFIGSGVGAILIMAVGALGAAINYNAINADPIGFLGHRVPAVAGLLIFVLLLSLLPASAESPYGAFLTSLAAISPGGKLSSAKRSRVIYVVGFTVVSLVVTIAFPNNILNNFENVILFLLYLLVPWTAINLTDYYLVRHRSYDIPGLLRKDGPYGQWNIKTLVIYLVTILLEIPFVNSSLYEGPIAKHLGGADISWIVGLVFASVVYYLYARGQVHVDNHTTSEVTP